MYLQDTHRSTNGKHSNKEAFLDYIVLGAGPAGLQMGYYLKQAGANYLILERGEAPGTFFKQFPRRRSLISVNKVYTGFTDKDVNLRWDWNSLLCDDDDLLFKKFSTKFFPSADCLVEYLADFASKLELNVRHNVHVMNANRDRSGFHITDADGTSYHSARLIIATGVSKPYRPNIPGMEMVECYTTASVNPMDYAGQRVLIIGKGNSSFEMAETLTEATALLHVASPSGLKLAWKTHHPGHLRAVNNNFLDTYLLKTQNAVLDATITEIRKEDDKLVARFEYVNAVGEEEEIRYDRIICCTGFAFDHSIFDETCKPELCLNDRFPAQTPEWESVNVPGMYFAGTLSQANDFKKAASAFIHGFRYNVRSLHRMLRLKYHDEAWPSKQIDLCLRTLCDAVIERVNSTSGLWQQFGFLADLLVVDQDTGTIKHFRELPVAYAHWFAARGFPNYYLLTLEYGAKSHLSDPFTRERVPRDDARNAEESNFLHPVIRQFDCGALVAEHHIIENLEGVWREPEHVEPLQEFFALVLQPT